MLAALKLYKMGRLSALPTSDKGGNDDRRGDDGSDGGNDGPGVSGTDGGDDGPGAGSSGSGSNASG